MKCIIVIRAFPCNSNIKFIHTVFIRITGVHGNSINEVISEPAIA